MIRTLIALAALNLLLAPAPLHAEERRFYAPSDRPRRDARRHDAVL